MSIMTSSSSPHLNPVASSVPSSNTASSVPSSNSASSVPSSNTASSVPSSNTASSVPSSNTGRPQLRFGYDHPPTATPPTSDGATFRDLLIFEERLKQNAARLLRRKRKYQTILTLLCFAILCLSYRVLFHQTSPLLLICYMEQGLLIVCCTTLFLFFASGMYNERIVAANRFVPQANRALRPFNMYLNTRKQPRRNQWFQRVFPQQQQQQSSNSNREAIGKGAVLPLNKGSTTGSTFNTNTSTTTRLVRGTPDPNNPNVPPPIRRMVIPPIPPSNNPRGEIIFSTKVAPTFREGYERYRNAFERRRKEKLVATQSQSAFSTWVSYITPQSIKGLSSSTSSGGDERPTLTSTTAQQTRARPRNNSSSNPSSPPIRSRRGSAASTEGTLRRNAHRRVRSTASSSSSSRSSSPDSNTSPLSKQEEVPELEEPQRKDEKVDIISSSDEENETESPALSVATLPPPPLQQAEQGSSSTTPQIDGGWIEVRRTASYGARKKRNEADVQ
ncbi:unnamed protein product [Sympodiomycopsis kandeliae]